jgi:hypothetical protein
MLNYPKLVHSMCLQSVIRSWRMLKFVKWDDDAISQDGQRTRSCNITKRILFTLPVTTISLHLITTRCLSVISLNFLPTSLRDNSKLTVFTFLHLVITRWWMLELKRWNNDDITHDAVCPCWLVLKYTFLLSNGHDFTRANIFWMMTAVRRILPNKFVQKQTKIGRYLELPDVRILYQSNDRQHKRTFFAYNGNETRLIFKVFRS